MQGPGHAEDLCGNRIYGKHGPITVPTSMLMGRICCIVEINFQALIIFSTVSQVWSMNKAVSA